MSLRTRLAAITLALALPAASLWGWLSAANAGLPPEPFPDLPSTIGPWRATAEQELTGDVWELIQPTDYIFARYESPTERPIWVYVGAYAGRVGYDATAHDPKACYPSAGFEIVEAGTRTLELSPTESLVARRIVAQRNDYQETVLYWFQPAERWPRGPAIEQLLQVVDALAGRPQFAFVRLSAPSAGAGEAEAELVRFAHEIARPLRASITAYTAEAENP